MKSNYPVLNFFKPTFLKVSLAVFIWMILIAFVGPMISVCYLGDCMRDGRMVPCCPAWVNNNLIEVLKGLTYIYPLIGYSIACLVFIDKKPAK